MPINLLRKIKRKLFKKKKIKLKHELAIKQNSNIISIQGKLSKSHYLVKELWFFSRNDEENMKVCEISPSNEFNFTMNLDELYTYFSSDHSNVYDLYMKVSIDEQFLSPKKLTKLAETAEFIKNDEGRHNVEYFIRFGRFQDTLLKGATPYIKDDTNGLLFITLKGNLSFAVNTDVATRKKLQIDLVQSSKNLMKISGKMFTKNSLIQDGHALLKGRESNAEFEIPLEFLHQEEETKKKYGLNRYNYTINLQVDTLAGNQLIDEDIYDIFLKLKFHDEAEERLLRVGRPAFRAKHFTKEVFGFIGNTVSIFTPYYTFKQANLSLEVYHFPKKTFNYLMRILRWSWLLRPLNKRKDIWLVGERSYKAQDTGYHFFRFMREKYPSKNVYYVIDKDSPEYRNVEPYGNVLEFKSKQHIWYTLMATRVISSHHPDYLYPIRSPRFKKAVKGLKVFLQHGVMGTKNMVANYGKNAPGFNTDLFLVSSEFEKNMIVHDFGYDEKEVFVTGLSRFDQLLNEDTQVKRQLLIIPTWRDWLSHADLFLESEYFNRYSELIHHPQLHRLAKENNFEITFCLHPNMQKYTPYFKDAPVKVISQGEVDVQSLLKESAMMITDYSSVGFDFSFLHKPIIYYQFDRNQFIGKRPSHLDLDNDLPGDIVDNVNDLLHFLEGYVQDDFKMKDAYKKRSSKFLTYRDTSSSERIYQVMDSHFPSTPKIKEILGYPMVKDLGRRFRKSSYYFPTMKVFYSFASKVFPVDQSLILFESSIGKQYADSPKVIYEELLRQNKNYRYVWVYNKNDVRFINSNTKKVKRLSVEYFYYLARAKFWVNNQNFPTYMKKRAKTTYIQTWHGTPLKKMLFDIENIQGRSDDYLDRVHQATQSWDYLVSPSEYASKAFRSAFRYEGEILETGYPRNDIFYREERNVLAQNVKKRLKLPEGKKVILYAPTFRDNQTKGKNKFTFKLNMDLNLLKESLGDEYILLLRMHVVISNKLTIPEELRDFVYNVSSYSDIQELYLISDVLMTDYSSVMFDFANTHRPILYYTYDLDEYRDDIRGFYIDFEQEAPGPFLKSTEDIIHAVQNINQVNERYKLKYERFNNKYCGLEDGKASKRIVDKVF